MTEPMTHDDARELGYWHGYDMTDFAVADMPDATDSEIEEACIENQEHFRQFSPFEFYAAGMNAADDPDSVWEAYEEGFTRGITSRLMVREEP